MRPGFCGDISANTISPWIVKAITIAYEAVSQQSDLHRTHCIRAHDVRAMAASLAFMRFVSWGIFSRRLSEDAILLSLIST
jgi:hypothetical protein